MPSLCHLQSCDNWHGKAKPCWGLLERLWLELSSVDSRALLRERESYLTLSVGSARGVAAQTRPSIRHNLQML